MVFCRQVVAKWVSVLKNLEVLWNVVDDGD